MNYSRFETSIAFIQSLGDNIIRVQVKKDVLLTQEGVKECRDVYLKILNGKKGLILTVFNEFNTAEQDIKREFEAPSHIELKAAEAFVVSSLSNRIELEFYTKMTKTVYPTAVFSEEKEAMKWLLDFQD